MKPPVPDNPDQVNIVTGRILLNCWLEFWAVVAHEAHNTASGSAVLGATIRRHGVSVAIGVVAVPSVARALIVANSASMLVRLFGCSTSWVTSVHRPGLRRIGDAAVMAFELGRAELRPRRRILGRTHDRPHP